MSDYTSRNALAFTGLEMSSMRKQSGPDDGESVAYYVQIIWGLSNFTLDVSLNKRNVNLSAAIVQKLLKSLSKERVTRRNLKEK